MLNSVSGRDLSPNAGSPTFHPEGRLYCQCCRQRPVRRPRGLCWTCYYTPSLREQFVSGSIYAKRGVGHGCRGYRLPDRPTQAPPGTDAKVRVLIDRMAEGVALWHPDDAGFVESAVPVRVAG